MDDEEAEVLRQVQETRRRKRKRREQQREKTCTPHGSDSGGGHCRSRGAGNAGERWYRARRRGRQEATKRQLATAHIAHGRQRTIVADKGAARGGGR